MKLVDPTGIVASTAAQADSLRKQLSWPQDLARVRVGFLSNGKPNIASLFEQLSASLIGRGAVPACSLIKPGPTTPAGKERIEQLADAAGIVITGVCDGGTATSWGVHDAVELASRGIPAVLVCTDAFVELAYNMLPKGIEGVRILAIPHPLSSLTDQEVGLLASHTASRLHTIMIESGGGEGAGMGRRATAEDHRIPSEDGWAASNAMFLRGWTEGLPAFLPTAERVERFLDEQNRALFRHELRVPPRNATATAEAVAANALLAGMPSELLPYLAAALEASCRPEFNLFGLQTTTNPTTPAIIVGGPRRREFGFHDGLGALGPGRMANATLGRALRLCHQNLGGASVRLGTDPATLGQPGKYIFCLAEDEGANPWTPLRMQVSPGLVSASEDAVTVMAATGTTNLIIKCRSGEEFMTMLSGSIRNISSNDYMFGGHPLLILCPEHASILANDGWTLEAIQQRVFDTTKIRFGDFVSKNQEMTIAPRAHEFAKLEADTMLPIVEHPADFLVCVAGGPSLHSCFVPSFGGSTPAVAKVALAASSARKPQG